MIARVWQRIGIVGLFILAGCAVALAAPFAQKVSYTQPDGTAIELWGEGDEFCAVFETLDGYTVTFDPRTQAYHYAKVSADGNELIPTGVLVGRATPPGLAKHLRIRSEAVKRQAHERWTRWDEGMEVSKRWEELKAARRQIEMAEAAASGDGVVASPPSSTTTGTKVGLCLLVDFIDDPWTVPQADIVNFCNGDSYTGYGNNGSVKKYYYDNSNGQLVYSNVVTIYIRVPQAKTYYNDTTKDCGTQGNILIRDAITAMKQLPNYESQILPTFNGLTVDANNRVIACNVYYAGGNGGVWSYGLWPHSWALYNVGAQELSPGGKKVWRYQITNIGASLQLGTFCHENGHMLCGFPDIYDYDYDSKGGAGIFCLMNSGGHGANPVQCSAYLKRAAGWATVTDLTSSDNLTATLTATAGANFNRFYRYRKPGVTTEYFLLENRLKTGRDANLPASGIAVWHIDEYGDRDNQSMVPNTTHANYEVTLVQADNLWHFQNNVNSGDARDLYYSGNAAAGYVNRFDDATAPNAHWWDGTSSGFVLRDFSVAGATMTVVVGGGGGNTPPVAVGDTATTAEDTAVSIPVLANDSDADGDTLSIQSVTTPPHGSAAIAGTSVTYTPAANWNGADSFSYTASDGRGGTASATVTVTITPVNDAPTAAADAATTPEDTAVGIAVLANDRDVDGDTLSIQSVTPPAHGSAAIAGTSVTYTPAANWNGADSFSYTASDGHGGTASASVTVTVTPVNDAPTAAADAATTAEDAAVSIAVLANDSDVDGDVLSIQSVTPPGHGVAAIAGTRVTYTPTANWNGTDTFSYTASDGHGGAASATVTVTVTPVNDAPAFGSDPIVRSAAFTDQAYSGQTLAGSAADPDAGDSLTYAKVSGPAWLTVAANGALSGTPGVADIGANSWAVSVTDAAGLSDTATLQINVTAADAIPPALKVPPDTVITLDDSTDPSNTGQATATDNLDPSPVVSYSDENAGTPPNPYVITRSWTARDAAGNTSSGTQRIIVIKVANVYASAQTTYRGSVAGTLADTMTSDNAYESLTETVSGGKPANRQSLLQHEWAFTVEPADFATFNIEAYHTPNSEGDDFAVFFRAAGTADTEMLRIVKTADDNGTQSYDLPLGAAGTVYISVLDTDATKGNYAADTLYVDRLWIQREVWPAGTLPPGPTSSPAPVDGATAIPRDVTLTWSAGVNATSSDVYFGAIANPGPSQFAGNTASTAYAPGTLAYDSTYYWRIDARNPLGVATGAVWSFRTETDPSITPTDMHVQSIQAGTAATGQKVKARALVTIRDNLGNPVSGATVTGTFSGSYSETRTGVTDASGVATLTTAGSVKPPVSFTFTVTGVSGALPYDPADNAVTSVTY